MRVGDKKQAIGLGLAALIAVGMLGKTAFGSFAASNSDQPMVVKEIGARSAPSNPSSDRIPDRQLNPEALKAQTRVEKENSTVIKRDAFEKPSITVRTKAFDEGALIKGRRSNGQISPKDPNAESMSPLGGTLPIPGVGDKPVEGPDAKKDKPVPKPEFTLRFDGFVDAGSPMAVLSLNGKSFSTSVGDVIGTGYTVESISSQKITIRKQNKTKTILIGKETEL